MGTVSKLPYLPAMAAKTAEERALPATGGGRTAGAYGEERALPATGGGRTAGAYGEERALPATGGGRRPEHTAADLDLRSVPDETIRARILMVDDHPPNLL